MPQQPVYSVTDLVSEMRQLMEHSYPEIWIEGELSSLSKPASGHLYFSLKDESSQLRCAMFRSRASLSRYAPKSGDLVRVRAKISVYPARGDLQCIVQHIEEAGEGVLQRRFEELKNKLNLEGLFAAEHKLQIPPFPQHIGLITSPSGAAVRDVLSTLARRSPGTPVTIYPAVVQGDGAAQSISAALQAAQLHDRCDVLILTRGGGSMEDLWCFNDESLARDIFACKLPLISAVGHEVDVTIADFVADLRAPTPTAAAELLSPERDKLLLELKRSAKHLLSGILRHQQQRSQAVDHNFAKLKHPSEALRQQRQKLHDFGGRLLRTNRQSLRHRTLECQSLRHRLKTSQPKKRLQSLKQQLQARGVALRKLADAREANRRSKLEHLAEQLHIVSPLATLGRGFAIARDRHERIIRDSSCVEIGETVGVQLARGSLDCKVLANRDHDSKPQ